MQLKSSGQVLLIRVSVVIGWIRADWTARSRLWFGQRSGGFVAALVIGDSALLGRSLKAATRELGILHLFAASGMNIAFMLQLVKPLSSKRAPLLLLSLVAIGFYLELTEIAASMVRASAMALYVLFGRLIWMKPISSVLSLIIPVSLLSLAYPQIWEQLGFRLSLAATAGILLWRTQLDGASSVVMLGGLARGWFGALRTGTVAQLWVTPLLLGTFHEISPIGILATAALAWICEPLFSLGVPLLIVDSLSLRVGLDLSMFQWVLNPLGWVIDWLLQGVVRLGSWSWPALTIQYWPEKYTLIWYMSLLVVTLGWRWLQRSTLSACAVWRGS